MSSTFSLSFSRWCECVVIPDSSAETTAQALLENWICRYGVPSTIICDKGSAFTSRSFVRLPSLLGVSVAWITTRHPEGNAHIETFHRSLKKQISAMHMNYPTIPFSTAVQLAAYSYRSTLHLSLGDSPAYLTFGTDLRSPVENDWRFIRFPLDSERLHALSEIRLQQYERAHAQYLIALSIDQPGRTHDLFHLGDIVLAHVPKNRLPDFVRNDGSRKIAPKYSMPARVVHVTSTKKTAVIRFFGSGLTQEIHIQDVRFLTPPDNLVLKKQWVDLACQETEMLALNPQKRQEYLEDFWEEVDAPQSEFFMKLQLEDEPMLPLIDLPP